MKKITVYLTMFLTCFSAIGFITGNNDIFAADNQLITSSSKPEIKPPFLDFPLPLSNAIMRTNKDREKNLNPNTLVFSGGGAKGLAYAGVMEYLGRTGKISNVNRIIGASAGSIFAGFLSIGFDYKEINQIVKDENFIKFVDAYGDVPVLDFVRNPWDLLWKPVKTVIMLTNLVNHFGVCKGDYAVKFFDEIFQRKGFDKTTTFKQLHDATDVHLVLISCSVVYGQTRSLDYIHTPDMSVIEAMRASMSIPAVYKPVDDYIHYKIDGKEFFAQDMLVDGGTTNNFPLWYFDTEGGLTDTVGFLLDTKESVTDPKPVEIKGLKEFGFAVAGLLMNNVATVLDMHNDYRTIFIDCGTIDTLSFDMSAKDKELLYKNGFYATKAYFGGDIEPDPY